MPPARLPARIDRSGLGGGSFFSPAAGESVLATGAVAAATEAMLDSGIDSHTQVSASGPTDRLLVKRAVLCRVERARRAAAGRGSGVGSLFPEMDTASGPRSDALGVGERTQVGARPRVAHSL